MVKLNQIKIGLESFVMNEMIAKLPDMTKQMLSTAALKLALRKSDNLMNLIKENKVLKALDIITENGDIDIDLIEEVIAPEIEKNGSLQIEIPLLGMFKFKRVDIEKLITMIKES